MKNGVRNVWRSEMPDNRNVCGDCGDIYGEEFAKECSCPKKQEVPLHLTVKKLRETLAQLPDDYVVCMSADTKNGYVVGGTHYKVDPLAKAVFIIDITSLPENDDVKF